MQALDRPLAQSLDRLLLAPFNYLFEQAMSLLLVCLLVFATTLCLLLSLFIGAVTGTWFASYLCFFFFFFFFFTVPFFF